MTSMSVLRSRADQLRSLGLSSHRVYWRLRKEFPNGERDMIVNAAGLPGAHTGISPWWSTWGRSLRPTQIRFQQKGRPAIKETPVVVRTVGEEPPPKKTSRSSQRMERLAVFLERINEEVEDMLMGAPTITVPATEVDGGDWVVGSGEVVTAMTLKDRRVCLVFESGEARLLNSDARVEVRLEDEKED